MQNGSVYIIWSGGTIYEQTKSRKSAGEKSITAALLDLLNQFHEEVAGTMLCTSVERYQLYVYIGSLYNTAMMWLKNGKKEDINQISKLFYGNCIWNK